MERGQPTCEFAARTSSVSSNTTEPGVSNSDRRSARIATDSCHRPNSRHPFKALSYKVREDSQLM